MTDEQAQRGRENMELDLVPVPPVQTSLVHLLTRSLQEGIEGVGAVLLLGVRHPDRPGFPWFFPLHGGVDLNPGQQSPATGTDGSLNAITPDTNIRDRLGYGPVPERRLPRQRLTLPQELAVLVSDVHLIVRYLLVVLVTERNQVADLGAVGQAHPVGASFREKVMREICETRAARGAAHRANLVFLSIYFFDLTGNDCSFGFGGYLLSSQGRMFSPVS